MAWVVAWVMVLAAGVASAAVEGRDVVVLRVVRVRPDWHAFVHLGGGFASGMKHKVLPGVRVLDVAIWDEIGAVHLYAFDETFRPHPDGMAGETAEAWTAHRESFLIRAWTGIPAAPDYDGTRARSLAVQGMFESLVAEVRARYPEAAMMLSFSGHGSGGGLLFANLIHRDHARVFLHAWTGMLGEPLLAMDFGGPCNMATVADFVTFAPYARYIVASDLPNGGYEWDAFSAEIHEATSADTQLPLLLSAGGTVGEVLAKRVDLVRQRYLASRTNMTTNKVEQAVRLFDSEAVLRLLREMQPVAATLGLSPNADLRTLLVASGRTDLVTLFDASIVRAADNRDFFPWEVPASGIAVWYANPVAATVTVPEGMTTRPAGSLQLVLPGDELVLDAIDGDLAEFRGWRHLPAGSSWTTSASRTLRAQTFGPHAVELLADRYARRVPRLVAESSVAPRFRLLPEGATQVRVERSTDLETWTTDGAWTSIGSEGVVVEVPESGAWAFLRATGRAKVE